MKKLVLGIVSVFLTQLVFVAYNWNGDELAADVGRVSEYKVEPDQWPVIRSVRPPYPETIAVVTEVTREAEPRVSPQVVTIAAAKTPRNVEKRNTIIKNDLEFKPTFITYSSVPVTFADRPQKASATPPERLQNLSAQSANKKKRTLIQKTGSVLKKPFVWMKNLVAKLD